MKFLKLVEGGDYFGAASVARADLRPLAARFLDLLRPLKETFLALAWPRGEPALKPTPPYVLVATLGTSILKIGCLHLSFTQYVYCLEGI